MLPKITILMHYYSIDLKRYRVLGDCVMYGGTEMNERPMVTVTLAPIADVGTRDQLRTITQKNDGKIRKVASESVKY